MRRRRAVTVAVPVGMVMVMVMVMGMAVGMGMNHGIMLYYNITSVHMARLQGAHGFPITIAIAAARNGNGTDTAARNQTNRAGMNGISHNISRWKANSAQAIT